MKKVILQKGKEKVFEVKHPWIYSGAIRAKDNDIQPGEVVNILDEWGNIRGCGFYFPSSLQIKILSFDRPFTHEIWKEKIHRAVEYRKHFHLPSLHTNAFRCFFGEADGIPGLIADYYNEILVIHFHHEGLYNHKDEILNAFLTNKNLYIKSVWLESKEEKTTIYSSEEDPVCPIEIMENNLNFLVDWKDGQKTGFFLDQRENRNKVMHLSKDKEVLNLFSYTGAFSIYALQGGAKSVVSVDSSSWATEQLKKNLLLNEFPEQEIVTMDVFDYLKTEKRTFDLVICDPPAFAKNLKSRHNALMAYKRLNAMAMEKVRPGGILVTFSCSGVVGRDLFYHTIVSACLQSRSEWRVLESLYPGPDHPINPNFPEGDYLKGLLLIRSN
jgi:23S rRNA (cytosine1962-C5)-methyltransferase